MTRFSCGKRDSKDEWFLPQSRVYELRQRERPERVAGAIFSSSSDVAFFFKKWKKTAQKEGNKTSSDDFIHRSGSSRL